MNNRWESSKSKVEDYQRECILDSKAIRKSFQVEVNPYIEFMNAILLTSQYNEITRPYVGYGLMTDEKNVYTSALKRFLEPYKNEPIYQLIEGMIPIGFSFSRPVELMLCLGKSNDFKLKYRPSDLCIQYCGGMEQINTLLGMLKAFEKQIDFFYYWNSIKNYYAPIIKEVYQNTNTAYVYLLEEQYGMQQSSYHIVLSSLMKGNYGIYLNATNHLERDIFTVFSTDRFSLSTGILFHENSHPFINPLTEKYRDLVETYSGAYEKLKKYKRPNFESGYSDLEECVNEHLVRAMSIHLLQKIGDQNQANDLLNYDISLGYRYIPEILRKYDYFDEHRNTYVTFEDFYPELLMAFQYDIDA